MHACRNACIFLYIYIVCIQRDMLKENIAFTDRMGGRCVSGSVLPQLCLRPSPLNGLRLHHHATLHVHKPLETEPHYSCKSFCCNRKGANALPLSVSPAQDHMFLVVVTILWTHGSGRSIRVQPCYGQRSMALCELGLGCHGPSEHETEHSFVCTFLFVDHGTNSV